jgi:nickel-dependent lactate racemase
MLMSLFTRQCEASLWDSSRFNLPPDWSLTTLEPNPSTPLPDLRAAVEGALSHPIGAAPLTALASPHSRVCLVFTDATRACPDHIIVPAILRELDRAGVPDEHITLLCATGLHRPSTHAEKIAKLGEAVVQRYRVIDHDVRHCEERSVRRSNLLPIGSEIASRPSTPLRSAQGALAMTVPDGLTVNRLLWESDLIIATGVVEPHQYAGYSGGGKTVIIGCGSEGTIGLTHGPQFLDRSGVRLGQIESNPFQQFVREAARAIGLKFVVNVVLDGNGEAIAVQAGDPIAVHDALVAVARSVYEVPIEHEYDVVIAQVDPPKDVNLYQASRAATYIGLSATPPIRPGGAIIITARCPEGAGQGRGEERFFTALSQASDLRQLLAQYRRDGCRAGEQRAYMLAQVMLNYEVIVAGSQCPEVVEACHVIAALSLDEAIEYARQRLGATAQVLYLPHPLQTIPNISHRASHNAQSCQGDQHGHPQQLRT